MNENNEPPTADPVDKGAAIADADELQRERDDFYERLLRKTAEFDNYRKRVERDHKAPEIIRTVHGVGYRFEG